MSSGSRPPDDLEALDLQNTQQQQEDPSCAPQPSTAASSPTSSSLDSASASVSTSASTSVSISASTSASASESEAEGKTDSSRPLGLALTGGFDGLPAFRRLQTPRAERRQAKAHSNVGNTTTTAAAAASKKRINHSAGKNSFAKSRVDQRRQHCHQRHSDRSAVIASFGIDGRMKASQNQSQAAGSRGKTRSQMLDAVVKVRVGKASSPSARYEARRVVLSKPGWDATLRYFQKEAKRQPGGLPLLLRRTIFFRDVTEIQISKVARPKGAAVDDGDMHGSSDFHRIEVVTSEPSSRTNIGLEFETVSNFQNWHAALYSRWLRSSNGSASGPAGGSRSGDSATQQPSNVIPNSLPAIDLSESFFGLLSEYSHLITAKGAAQPMTGTTAAARRKRHASAVAATTEVALQLQALHENFVHCATVAAQNIVEKALFTGMVDVSAAAAPTFRKRTVYHVVHESWPLAIRVTSWDPCFKDASSAGQDKWKLEGHALRNARYVQFAVLTKEIEATGLDQDQVNADRHVRIFTQPVCIVDYLGVRATVSLQRRKQRTTGAAQRARLLPARSVAQVIQSFNYPSSLPGSEFHRHCGLRATVHTAVLSTAAMAEAAVRARARTQARARVRADDGSKGAVEPAAVFSASSRKAAAAAFGGSQFADVFAAHRPSASCDEEEDFYFVIDHSSLALVTPHELLCNGNIATAGVEASSASAAAAAIQSRAQPKAVRRQAKLCRRLRPELFGMSKGAASGTRSSTVEAMMQKLRESAPGGNLALVGSAKVLQRVPEVVRMLGSLVPKSQRVPVNVEATSNALPYAWDVLSSSHITPSIVAKAFHSAGVGLRHMGYAAHLAAFNNSHPFLATLFEKMIIARCCKVLLRTKLLQHIADHSEDNSDSNGLPPRRHGGFSGVAIAQDDAPMPQAEDGMAEVGPPNDDGSWESLDEDFEVGIERVPEAAPGTPPSGGSVAESHTPCDSGAPTPRAKDSELRRSTQMHKTISNLLESYPAELAALMQSPQAEASPAELQLPKYKKPKTPKRITNSLEFFSIRQVKCHIAKCCTEFVSLVLGDSEEGDNFWREQIAREAHTRFNYDIFRSCAVQSELTFEESRIGGVDHSAGFLGTVADLRSSPIFRTELLAQCGLHRDETARTFAPVPRVKHTLPALPTDGASKASIVGNSGSSSSGHFSSASALALQSLHGFVQYELFKAKNQVSRIIRVDASFSVKLSTEGRLPSLGFSVNERDSTLGRCGVSSVEDDLLATKVQNGDVVVAVDGFDVRGLGPRDLQLYVLQDIRKRSMALRKEIRRRKRKLAKKSNKAQADSASIDEHVTLKLTFERLDNGTKATRASRQSGRLRIEAMLKGNKTSPQSDTEASGIGAASGSGLSDAGNDNTLILDAATRNALTVAMNELRSACGGRAIFTPIPANTVFNCQITPRHIEESCTSTAYAVSQSRTWRLAQITSVAEWLTSQYTSAVDRARLARNLHLKGAVERRMLRNACLALASFVEENCNSRDGNSFVSSDDVRVKLLVKRRLEYLEETAVFRRASSGSMSTSSMPSPQLTEESLELVKGVDGLLGPGDAFTSPFAAACRFEAALLCCPLLRQIASEHFLPTVITGDLSTKASEDANHAGLAVQRGGENIVEVQAHDVPSLKQAALFLREGIRILRRAVGQTHPSFAHINIVTAHVHCLLGEPRAAEELFVTGLEVARMGLRSSRRDSASSSNQERAEVFEQAHRLRSDIQFATSSSVAFTKLSEIQEQTGNFSGAFAAVQGALEYLHSIEARAGNAIDDLQQQHLQQRWRRGNGIALFTSAPDVKHVAKAAGTAPVLPTGTHQSEWWTVLIHRLYVQGSQLLCRQHTSGPAALGSHSQPQKGANAGDHQRAVDFLQTALQTAKEKAEADGQQYATIEVLMTEILRLTHENQPTTRKKVVKLVWKKAEAELQGTTTEASIIQHHCDNFKYLVDQEKPSHYVAGVFAKVEQNQLLHVCGGRDAVHQAGQRQRGNAGAGDENNEFAAGHGARQQHQNRLGFAAGRCITGAEEQRQLTRMLCTIMTLAAPP